MTYRDILNALNTDTWCNLTEEEKLIIFRVSRTTWRWKVIEKVVR